MTPTANPPEDHFTSPAVAGLCPVCDGTRRILRPRLVLLQHRGYERLPGIRGLPCPECEPEAARAAVSEVRQAEIDRMLNLARVPDKFRDVTLKDFCDDPQAFVRAGLPEQEGRRRREWKAKLGSYLRDLGKHLADGVGLSLEGPVGTGKTLATCIVVRAAVALHRSCVLIPERGIFQALQASWKDDAPADEADVLAQFETVDLLCIDDFGTKRPTDWVVDRYHSIIDARWDRGLPTCISTNVREKDLRATYPRQMDRLSRNWKIGMMGMSLRGTKLER